VTTSMLKIPESGMLPESSMSTVAPLLGSPALSYRIPGNTAALQRIHSP
jgi:hypothetical protein